MIVGYARVSTDDQKLDLQLRALEAAGCDVIYRDHGRSGSTFERVGLDEALERLAPGGTLVVWRLDRLGRSLSGLIRFMEILGKREINFRSLMESIDTSSSSGRLMFHLMAALAEFERALISERTRAGMAVARTKGVHVGRPRSINTGEVKDAMRAIQCDHLHIAEIAEYLGVSRRTLRRYLLACGCPISCSGNCLLCGKIG